MVFFEQGERPLECYGLVMLCDLVSEGLVTVEVVFPVERGDRREGAVERACELEGVEETLVVEFRLGARKRHVEEGCGCVCGEVEVRGWVG